MVAEEVRAGGLADPGRLVWFRVWLATVAARFLCFAVTLAALLVVAWEAD